MTTQIAEVAATPAAKSRAFDWVRRTWQPTQEQVEALTKTARATVEARLALAAERLRALLGGPTREELGDLGRRLARIEARLETLGLKDAKEPKEKKAS
jgi:hypothetical protein